MRVAVAAYSWGGGGGGGGGGVLIKILDGGCDNRFSNTPIPDFRPKQDSFLTCFQTWFLKVRLSFVIQYVALL